MNDFTKEELISILEAMTYWHEGIETSLHDKIQSLIDNYEELNRAYVAKVDAPFDEKVWSQPGSIIRGCNDE